MIISAKGGWEAAGFFLEAADFLAADIWSLTTMRLGGGVGEWVVGIEDGGSRNLVRDGCL